MADSTSDAVDGVTLEGAAAAWLGERADELGVSEEELLERLVAAYRDVDGGDAPGVVTEEELSSRLDGVESEFESQLGEVESEFDEKIEDVRERVIQVKREADAKAPADHDHDALSERVNDALEAVRAVEDEQESVSERVDALAERVDAGFENYEEVLSYLRDETDELDRKTTTLATAVLSMRESLASLAAAEAHRERAEALQREANRAGVREADCGECGESVTVGQLSAPECPFCGATFDGVEANSGWFGSHTLLTGGKPALESGKPLDEGDWMGGDTESLEEMAELDEDSENA